MNRPRPISLPELCALFEVDIRRLPDMSKPGPMHIVEKKLETFKEVFHKAYRKLALKYHPDKGASDKDIERFKKITSIHKDLAKLKVMPMPRPRPRTVIIRTGGFGGYSGTTSSTTSGGWSSGGQTFYWSSGGGSDSSGD